MNELTGFFAGVGSCQLYYHAWLPPGPAKAVLAIIPGDGDHIGRYQHLVEALAPAGYLLAGYDRRGNGRSQGKRGFIQSWDEYRQDQRIFLGFARGLFRPQSGDLPVFLFGHSGGAMVALDYILHVSGSHDSRSFDSTSHDSNSLAGCILSGIGIEPVYQEKTAVSWLLKVLSMLYPGFSRKTDPDPGNLSHDPQVFRDFRTDPLVHTYRNVRWITENQKTLAWVKNRAGEIDLPVLMIHGELDPYCTAAGARRYFEQIQHPDKTLHIYSGALHELHNELDYLPVMADLKQWLDRHGKGDLGSAAPKEQAN